MVIHSGKTQAQVRPMLGFKRFETAAVTIRGNISSTLNH